MLISNSINFTGWAFYVSIFKMKFDPFDIILPFDIFIPLLDSAVISKNLNTKYTLLILVFLQSSSSVCINYLLDISKCKTKQNQNSTHPNSIFSS